MSKDERRSQWFLKLRTISIAVLVIIISSNIFTINPINSQIPDYTVEFGSHTISYNSDSLLREDLYYSVEIISSVSTNIGIQTVFVINGSEKLVDTNYEKVSGGVSESIDRLISAERILSYTYGHVGDLIIRFYGIYLIDNGHPTYNSCYVNFGMIEDKIQYGYSEVDLPEVFFIPNSANLDISVRRSDSLITEMLLEFQLQVSTEADIKYSVYQEADTRTYLGGPNDWMSIPPSLYNESFALHNHEFSKYFKVPIDQEISLMYIQLSVYFNDGSDHYFLHFWFELEITQELKDTITDLTPPSCTIISTNDTFEESSNEIYSSSKESYSTNISNESISKFTSIKETLPESTSTPIGIIKFSSRYILIISISFMISIFRLRRKFNY